MSSPPDMAFTEDQVCRLTGLSARQLRYWAKTEFFRPWYSVGSRGLYSFRDLVGLRTIALLRNRVPLQELRKVGKWLRKYREDAPWARLRFFVAGRKVYTQGPGDPYPLTHDPRGQEAIPMTLEAIASEMHEQVARLRARPSDTVGLIDVARGKAPVVSGTRVPTARIWELHEAGQSAQEIVEAYSAITKHDVRAAIDFENGRRKKTA